MSAFLAPIHYWLYNKIRHVINREHLLYEKAEAECGTLAEELREQIWQSYGSPLLEKDLAELIDLSNIHGWLQRQINTAETREAAFINELISSCGDAGQALVSSVFQAHGITCGRLAQEQGAYDSSRADSIYKAVNDFYLNGMPCDQADMVIASLPEKVVWEGKNCLQEPNWKRAGADISLLKEFYRTWLASFVAAMNPNYRYQQTEDHSKGELIIRHEIVRSK